jgi:hypothetical protein
VSNNSNHENSTKPRNWMNLNLSHNIKYHSYVLKLPVHLICGLLREMEKVLPFSISLCVDGYVTAFEIKSAEDKPTIVRVVWSIYNTFDATTEKKSQIKRVHLLPVTALKSTPLLHNPNKRNIDYVDKSSKRQKN